MKDLSKVRFTGYNASVMSLIDFNFLA